MTGAFAGHCLAPCDLRSLGLGSLPASLPVAWSLAAPMLPLTFGHSAMGAFQLPCFLLRYRCPVLCRVLLLSRFLRSCLLVLMQLVMLRLDILWIYQRWLLGFGFFLRLFLWRFGPLCCTLYSSVHAPAALPAFVEPLAGLADESGAVTWIQGFFCSPFWWLFLSTSRGTPSPRSYSGMDLHGVAIGLPTVTRCLQVAGTPSKKT